MPNRFVGIDLLKFLAVFFVIAGHFFINTDFTTVSFGGVSMFFLASLKRLTSISVPVFLTVTGYLNLYKTTTKQFYLGGIKVLYSYILISTVTIAYFILFKDVRHSITDWILQITSFKAIAYGWYIEMWIGLFLMTPFVNSLWHSIKSKREHKILIFTLFILTAVPNLLNKDSYKIVPGFWMFMYPILFYYIGAYLRYYQIRFRPIYIWLLMFLCFINPTINLIFGRGQSLVSGSPFGVMGVLICILFCLCFYKYSTKSTYIKAILKSVSTYSLDIYLVSYLFDCIYYPIIKEYVVLHDLGYLSFYLIITPLVFLSSYLFAFMKSSSIKLLFKFPKLVT